MIARVLKWLPSCRALKFAGFAMIFCYCACPGNAQTAPDKSQEALDIITKAAERLCGSVPRSGSQQSFSVQGDIKAELLGLLKNLGNLGISGLGKYSEERYEGVLQNQLADTLKDERHCKEDTFFLLVHTLMTSSSQSLLPARLTFTRIEPFEQHFLGTDGKTTSFMAFKVWFANVGQSAAQNQTFAMTAFVTPTALSAKQEEDDFDSLKKEDEQFKAKLVHNDIQSGSNAFFFQPGGPNSEAWTEFNKPGGTMKFLYVMSVLTYHSENDSDNLDEGGKMITETCVIYQSGNISEWFNCSSGHNVVYKIN